MSGVKTLCGEGILGGGREERRERRGGREGEEKKGREGRRAEGEKGRDKRRQHSIMDIAAAAHAYMYVHGTYIKLRWLCIHCACMVHASPYKCRGTFESSFVRFSKTFEQ